nr:hypothetical protein [Hyphomonas sp. 34-62-18]
MSIGLNLIGTLMFLSPGFIPILIEHLRSGSVIRRPTLSSGSILVLGIVPAFACIAHFVGMMLYALNSLAPILITWPWDPNPYPALQGAFTSAPLSGNDGAKILLGLTVVNLTTLGTYAACREGVIKLRRRIMKRAYGWEAVWPGEAMIDALYRIQETDPNRALLATVETSNPDAEIRSGWVGPVEHVRLDNSEAIVSVALQVPSKFSETESSEWLFGANSNYLERVPDPPYMVVVIPASEIRSIRFSLSKGVETESENPNADVLTQSTDSAS